MGAEEEETYSCLVWLPFLSGSGNSHGPPDFLQFEHVGNSLLHLILRFRHSRHAAGLVAALSLLEALLRRLPLLVLVASCGRDMVFTMESVKSFTKQAYKSHQAFS